MIRKKSFRAAYISGGHIDIAGWGNTPAEAVSELKRRFFETAAKQAHESQVEAEKEGRGYSFEHRLKLRLQWHREYLEDNAHLQCEWWESEGTQDQWDNGIEIGIDSGAWHPKYEIKLGF